MSERTHASTIAVLRQLESELHTVAEREQAYRDHVTECRRAGLIDPRLEARAIAALMADRMPGGVSQYFPR